jgi:hypothetical protein
MKALSSGVTNGAQLGFLLSLAGFGCGRSAGASHKRRHSMQNFHTVAAAEFAPQRKCHNTNRLRMKGIPEQIRFFDRADGTSDTATNDSRAVSALR